MKVVKFILKTIGTLLGVVTAIYVVGMYASFTFQSSVNKKSVKKLVNNIDLIADSSKIFTDNDRVVERAINDIKVGNLTYEDKKNILYDSKLYSSVEEYLTRYIYYSIGYEDNRYTISEKEVVNVKKDIKESIQRKTSVTEEELYEVDKQIDKLYKNLEEVELPSISKIFPEEYDIVVYYVNSTGVVIIQIVLLIILLIMIRLLTRSYVTPFNWLTIGLFLSTILSIGLKFVLSNFEKFAKLPISEETLENILIKRMKDIILDTVNTSVIVTIILLLISFVITVTLIIKSKNKSHIL